MDPEGNVWVAESTNRRISKFTPDGAFLASYTGYQPGNGAFSPSAIIFGPQGDLYVLDFASVPIFQIYRLREPPPRPELGKLVRLDVVKGKVFVKLPAGSARASGSAAQDAGFVPLTEARTVPVRSILDTTRGTVKLTAARNKAGKTQSGQFTAGVFQVLQSRKTKAKGLTELTLKGSSFKGCGGAGAKAALSNRTVRRLRATRRGAIAPAAATPPPPFAARSGPSPTAATALSPPSSAARSSPRLPPQEDDPPRGREELPGQGAGLGRRGGARHAELRDAVAVLARGAEEVAVGLRALEEEVQVVLPREADAAVHLERRRRSRASRRRTRTPSPPTPRATALRLGVGGVGGEVRDRRAPTRPPSASARNGARRAWYAPIGRSNCLRSLAYSTAISIVRCAMPVSSAASAVAIRSSARLHVALERLAAVGRDARELARRVDRVDLLDVGGRALLRRWRCRRRTSTITAASSASGTSGARPSLISPTVPGGSPDAIPGSHFASARRCRRAGSRARRPRSRGTATAPARSRAPPSGSPARRCRAPGPRAPRR